MLIQLLKQKSVLTGKNYYLKLSLLYLVSFLIPFLIQGPQLLVGSMINFLLIIAITHYKFKTIIPALVLPSLSVYIYGLLFGGAVNFLIYLIPIIVVGNAAYVTSYTLLHDDCSSKFPTNYLSVFLAAIIKSSLLFLGTHILVVCLGLPETFLTAMGITQLVTATVGGLLAVGIQDSLNLLD